MNATISSTSQISASAVGLTMDARSSVPGLDTQQTRQCFAAALTSAPQRLQAKIRDRPAPFISRQNVLDRIPVSICKAFNRVIASRADKRLSLVRKMVIGMRAAPR
jgi:hypothetical protein